MHRSNRAGDRLIAVFLLGVVALLPPVLLIFNRPERVLGVPILYLYVLVAWSLIIALSAAIAGHLGADENETPGPSENAEPGTTEEKRDA